MLCNTANALHGIVILHLILVCVINMMIRKMNW